MTSSTRRGTSPPATRQELLPDLIEGRNAALSICEDAWNDKQFFSKRMYSVDPVDQLIRAGGNFILNISASPFYMGKQKLRSDLVKAIAKHHCAPMVMVNQVGGNDSLIFDGSSMAVAADGTVLAQAKSFEEDLVIFDSESKQPGDIHAWPSCDEQCGYEAIVLGTRDYVRKCGFPRAIVGLSGGIDSALVAAVAVDALGKENVIGIGMPSQYSSAGQPRRCARAGDQSRHPVRGRAHRGLVRRLSRRARTGLRRSGVVRRARGRTTSRMKTSRRASAARCLMALSNRYGALVLTTGNKSEMAVGYCTLYGDMVGGLAPIADLPKLMVYKLSRWLNREREIIPWATIEKEPSAELSPGQKDSDSLPPYEVLDVILDDFIECYKTAAEIAEARGFDPALVKRVLWMVEKSEYKRQQAAPVLKVTPKAFGAGRRFPIAAKVEV